MDSFGDGGGFGSGGGGGADFGGTQMGGGDGNGFQGNFSQGGFSSSQQSPSTAKKRDDQNLVPLTIKQIKSATSKSDKYMVDGRELGQITIVGQIVTVEMKNTHIIYMLDDSTGKLYVRVYVDNEDQNMEKHEKFREGMYVRVVGKLNDIGGNVGLVGFRSLIPITDFNEVTFHNLEAIHCHLKFTKGGAAQDSNANNNNAGYNSNNAPSNNFSNPNHGGQQQQQQQQQQGGGDGNRNLTSIQAQIMDICLQNGDGDEGCSVDIVCTKMQGTNRQDIVEQLGVLSDEGFLYSTIDDEHFKSTDE